ncbi:sugar ABC transporter ATP-binding protein [Labrys monachus]|uniref:ABC-type sugar transport system ATPase subunit n=1 Tax=Labrys monachus TaxID=217067 RepID=A0ABU0FL52_9HYPH|nr:sugar ABC transporter ATP-binding protein [Labrys monachus]MDQ0395315.1 ABC-type sugar transport system ATPase subunit [Labrys monachus]
MIASDEKEPPRRGAPLLRMNAISKAFGRIRVLQDVDLALQGGEVHALLGENGAGKSTLMKILFGIVQPDAGTIEIDGLGSVRPEGPRHALSLGIGLVSQELSLVPQLDVARNIFLGQTPALRLVPRKRHRAAALGILGRLAPHLRADAPVSRLGMADRQLVEISRTLARGGRIIAFDEPTSSLTPAERDALFAVIRSLRRDGKAIIYISHRMDEIRAIADRFTVMRDGRVVASDAIAACTNQQLNELIAGRELSRAMEGRPAPVAARMPAPLELRGLSTARLAGIDLAVRAGEIVGLAGLVGSGRSAILRAVFGLDRRMAGEIRVGGRVAAIESPADAMAAGIALIPEDRRGHAIVPMMSVEQNFGLASQRRFSRFGILRRAARRREIERHVAELQIRPADVSMPLANLSGGNQQKAVIARWLATGARVFMFDEPTRGIDVGAKAEIYALLRRLAGEGAAILVVSSELPELLLLSNRIGIVSGGRLTRIVDNDADLNEEALMRYAGASEHA